MSYIFDTKTNLFTCFNVLNLDNCYFTLSRLGALAQ